MTLHALRHLSVWLRILAVIAVTEWGVIPEAAPLGLQTIRNRQATGWWTDEQIIPAYHGYNETVEPPEWAYRVAWQALCTPGDPNGYLFAFGTRDIKLSEVPTDSRVVRNGKWHVVFTRRFPYGAFGRPSRKESQDERGDKAQQRSLGTYTGP